MLFTWPLSVAMFVSLCVPHPPLWGGALEAGEGKEEGPGSCPLSSESGAALTPSSPTPVYPWLIHSALPDHMTATNIWVFRCGLISPPLQKVLTPHAVTGLTSPQ